MSRDVRPPVQMRRETSVTSRISTQDSDIYSSCQIKEYPAFKPLILYAVEHGIAMEPMMGKWVSSRVDLGYTELFCIPEVTSVFISSSDSVLGDSLLFHQENRGSLHV